MDTPISKAYKTIISSETVGQLCTSARLAELALKQSKESAYYSFYQQQFRRLIRKQYIKIQGGQIEDTIQMDLDYDGVWSVVIR